MSSDLVRAFLSHASSTGSRSTVLQPLVWLCGILLFGLVYMATKGAPSWAIVTITAFLGVVVVLYMASYIYFALKNPDALRSEKFTLSKMALEKNLIGDSTFGVVEDAQYLPMSQPVSALPTARENDK